MNFLAPLLDLCDRCDAVRMLFVRIDRELICAGCWKAAGSPFLRTAWEVK